MADHQLFSLLRWESWTFLSKLCSPAGGSAGSRSSRDLSVQCEINELQLLVWRDGDLCSSSILCLTETRRVGSIPESASTPTGGWCNDTTMILRRCSPHLLQLHCEEGPEAEVLPVAAEAPPPHQVMMVPFYTVIIQPVFTSSIPIWSSAGAGRRGLEGGRLPLHDLYAPRTSRQFGSQPPPAV